MLLLKLKGYDILQSKFGLYKIDGQDAGGIQFKIDLLQTDLSTKILFNGKLMLITFKTLEDQYDSQIGDVEKVINSIKITDV